MHRQQPMWGLIKQPNMLVLLLPQYYARFIFEDFLFFVKMHIKSTMIHTVHNTSALMSARKQN